MGAKMLRTVQTDLRKVLRQAAQQRLHRQELVDGQPAWVQHEREIMTVAVNRWRRELGLAPVTPQAVQRVEAQACGHIDYGDKFALGCAELACGLQPYELPCGHVARLRGRVHPGEDVYCTTCKAWHMVAAVPAGQVAVWDVQAGQVRWVTRGEAAAGLLRYGRRLGRGSPACGVAEQRAQGLVGDGR